MSHPYQIEATGTPGAWKLTSGERSVFGALLTDDTISRAQLAQAAGVTEGSVGVLLRRIRAKVSVHGVEIETVAGKGWRLIGRETWRRALAALSN